MDFTGCALGGQDTHCSHQRQKWRSRPPAPQRLNDASCFSPFRASFPKTKPAAPGAAAAGEAGVTIFEELLDLTTSLVPRHQTQEKHIPLLCTKIFNDNQEQDWFIPSNSALQRKHLLDKLELDNKRRHNISKGGQNGTNN
ncbi:hypothetical protein [Hymenobacter rubidus]|uniref:hypothetical protein n=1 Tax=Hymenobacter rubidus TaxID=1441626 RepID=UPI00191DCA5A|nr:hypothetical protein [Hymenobacter rubidus]